MLIGLCGKNAAGKTSAAEYLQKKGFYYRSLSDAVREEAKNRSLEDSRENLIAVGNDLRKKFGPGILADRVLMSIDKDKNYVIDSIRNPSEVAALKKRSDFFLFYIEANDEIRFKRTQSRARPGDPKTVQEFKKLEDKELKSAYKNAQQILEVIKMADRNVDSNGPIPELNKNIDKALQTLPQNFDRPDWDEYFMKIAKEVATRSNCVKRKVAAVIVKDKRIVSTGYNGTPRGVKNCNEGGCPRCNNFTDAGTKLDECLCSHGEENAIVQASYHGVGLKDSIIYTTFSPCLTCSKMIINAGIKKVVFNADYPLGETAKKMLEQAGVELVQIKI